MPRPSDSATRIIDVVFVSRDCTACRSLVDQLAQRRAVPARDHRVAFITDKLWSQLLALRSDRVSVIVADTSVAHAVGMRATPTLIAFSARTSRVQQVAVGITGVLDRFPVGALP